MRSLYAISLMLTILSAASAAGQIDSSDVNLAYTIASVIMDSGQGIDAAKPWLDKDSFSALSSIGYCYERLKDWKYAKDYYELYLTRAKKGSSGYNFAVESLDYVKQQLFMEEK